MHLHAPKPAPHKTERRRTAQKNKMTRTIIYILPHQYAKFQTKAVKMQRHFAELVRERIATLVGMKGLNRHLQAARNEPLLSRTENTIGIQIYLPVSMKQRIQRIQQASGVTQSGLFRLALSLEDAPQQTAQRH